MLVPLFDVSFRLFHVDLFFEFTVQESCLDVDLMDLQIEDCSDGKEHLNGVESCDWGECFVVVDAKDLCKTFCNQSSLVPYGAVIRVTLCDEPPSALDGCAAFWEVD